MENQNTSGSGGARFRAFASQVVPLIRVTTRAAIEHVRSYKAVEVFDVPVDPSEITCEWLTAVLCRDRPGYKVVSFRTEAVPTGTSTRWITSLEYNDDPRKGGLPVRIFAKSTRDLSQRILMGVSETIAGETSFYSDFRHGLPLEAPLGYHGAWDPVTWRSIVLMEDVVATKGAEFLTAATPVSRAQVADLLRNLAAMHGAMWGSSRIVNLQTPADIGRVFSAYTDMHARYRCQRRLKTDPLWV